VLAAIDCFTKRTENVPLKNMTYREVIVTPLSRNDGVNQDHVEGFCEARIYNYMHMRHNSSVLNIKLL
jgi:hypothetical protein